MILLSREGGDLDHTGTFHVLRSGGLDNTTGRQLQQQSLQEPSAGNRDYEEGTDCKELGTGRHDLPTSIHKARQSLQELAASIHVGAMGLMGHRNELTEVEMCSMVLRAGGSAILPSGAFHSVTTTSSAPAVYAYTFTNATLRKDDEKLGQTPADSTVGGAHGEGRLGEQRDSDADPSNVADSKTHDRQALPDNKDLHQPINPDFPNFDDFLRFLKRKLALFWRSLRLLLSACHCLLTRSCGKTE